MVGDKLLHMKFYDGTLDSIPAVLYTIRSRRNNGYVSKWYFQRRLNIYPPLEPYRGFRHAVCIAHTSEDQSYKAHISRYKNRASPSSPAENFTIPCRNRHLDCQLCGYDDFTPVPVSTGEHNELHLDLSMLGTYRQMYEVGNSLLWTTNTFAFEDALTLDHFFRALNATQKQK